MDIANKILEINTLKKELKDHVQNENQEIHFQFETLINKLINSTPTGELRNDLTNLNILFTNLSISSNILQTITLI